MPHLDGYGPVLEIIVHCYSYARYKPLHMESCSRCCGQPKRCMSDALSWAQTIVSSPHKSVWYINYS